MRKLMLLAAVTSLAMARPETYREKEDFQFSRSSTDEGSKSGFYGAQRGNMGGNYERAHNMDPLAQHQMSGLVKTVEGELGDGAKQTTGSVYTSANSRGIYGSGNFDLSNLEGRNFQEGESHGSQSHSSLASHHAIGYQGQLSTSDNTGYGSSQSYNSGYRQNYHSRYGGYNSAGSSEPNIYSSNHHQALDHLQSASHIEDRNLAQNSGYYSQAAGYQGHVYDQDRSVAHTSDGYGSNSQTRLVSGNPVKIVIRPGTRVVVPLAAQTYDASQSAASFDQNAINSETEVINGNDQQVVLKPKAKHYESSYSYRKEWEKHDTKPVNSAVPLTIPTANPYPVNSELYEDALGQTLKQRQSASGVSLQNHHSSHSGYNSAASSQSSDYNSHHHSSAANTASSAYHGAYSGDSTGAFNNRRTASDAYIGTANSGASSLNQVEDQVKPKSYQSQYSYHKSWERQGDPYIIIPSTNGVYEGESSGKLTATSLNQGAYGNSHQYGSHRHNSQQSYSANGGVDCDENEHIRVARSTDKHHHQALSRGDIIGQEELGQQTQQQWDKIEDLSQQTQSKWDNFEELGQQTQNTWDQLGQQTETKWDKLQNEGQQTQALWGQQETQNNWAIEDLGQKTQSKWDQHDVGQQTQNTWDKLESEPQTQTDLGQQTQDTWTMLENKPSGNDARLMKKPSEPDNERQNYNGMNMDHQSHYNTFEIAQSSNHQKHNTESHSLETSTNKSSSKFNHVHSIWDEIKKEEIGQESEDTVEADLTQTADLGQQTQFTWDNINHNENSYKPWHHETADEGKADSTNLEQSNKFSHITPNPHPWMYNQIMHHQDNRSNSNQYFAHNSSFSSLSGSHSHSWQQEHSTSMNISNVQVNSSESVFGSSLMGLWNKLENIEKQTILSQGNDYESSQYAGQQGNANVFGSHITNIKPLQSSKASSSTIKPSTEVVNKNDKFQPHDVGRGDIGPENSSNEQSNPADSKSYKTPEEIETLSLTKEADKHDLQQDNETKEDGGVLSVMSLDEQNHSENQDKEKQLRQNGASLTTVMNFTQVNNHHMHFNEEFTHMNDEKESHNMEQKFKNQGQQNLDQQTLVHQFLESHENQYQNTDQQFVDFRQQSEIMKPEQIEQRFETQHVGQSELIHQENSKHEGEDFGQENEQFDKVSVSGWKPDKNAQQEHNVENWGQANENLEQQSQSGWAEDMEDQQVQTAWKPIEDSQQQSHLTETFEQPKEDLIQQIQPAWNPTEDLEQNSQLAEPFAQPMEDLNQQAQTVWKPTENLQQHSPQSDVLFSQVDQNKENSPADHKQSVIVEELIVPKKVADIDSPVEMESVTEKPGFWKSVGSKFTSAKDKVTSWFSS